MLLLFCCCCCCNELYVIEENYSFLLSSDRIDSFQLFNVAHCIITMDKLCRFGHINYIYTQRESKEQQTDKDRMKNTQNRIPPKKDYELTATVNRPI